MINNYYQTFRDIVSLARELKLKTLNYYNKYNFYNFTKINN